MFVCGLLSAVASVRLESVPCILTRLNGVYALHSAREVQPDQAAHATAALRTLTTVEQVTTIHFNDPNKLI